MDLSVVHKVAVDRLRKKCYANDLVSGESLISYGDCRLVLGREMRIAHSFQPRFIRELESLGLVEVVNKKTLKIL